MNDRLARLRESLEDTGADSILLTHLPHIRWISGFSGSNAVVYIDKGQAIFVSDGRYTTQAKEQVQSAEIIIADQADLPASLLGRIKDGRLGFTSDSLSVASRDHLAELFPKNKLVPLTGFMDKLMAPKSPAEIESIKNAQRITDKVFMELLEFIRPGQTEKEIAAEITYRQLRAGAEGMSFAPIVAAGANGAKPHAEPSDYKLSSGDLVILDFGCVFEGYCSDMTRTIAIGKPDKQSADAYKLVLESQTVALGAARSGMTGVQLDAVAREVIQAGGYDIPHGLGHGLGIEVHEWPAANKRNHDPLPDKTVLTIEPGVYVPGKFGIRIEDMVQLQPDGNINLTASPKELIEL